MQRVDGAYLYELGESLRAIKNIKAEDTSRIEVMIGLYGARDKLTAYLYSSVFQSAFRPLMNPATTFLTLLRGLAPDFSDDVDYEEVIPGWRIATLQREFEKFEAVLLATLQTVDLYYVSPKGAFDTQALTDGGALLFPTNLEEKAPEALVDVGAAARCIAFELPTAAAFHLLRATESVLRRYFDEKVGAEHRPTSRNMADFINGMRTRNVGDPRVIHALQALKDLHRNPLMHPDESLASAEEAINLYAAVRAAVGYMLNDMTGELAPVVAPLPLEEPEQPQRALPMEA